MEDVIYAGSTKDTAPQDIRQQTARHGTLVIEVNIILGECSALWASVSEALCMVGVYVSSHRKLIGHIGCCRSPQLLAFTAGRAHTGRSA